MTGVSYNIQTVVSQQVNKSLKIEWLSWASLRTENSVPVARVLVFKPSTSINKTSYTKIKCFRNKAGPNPPPPSSETLLVFG